VSARWRAALALLVLGLTALFFGPAIVGDQAIYMGDLRCFIAPRDHLLAASVQRGDWPPQWIPGIFGGAPGLASQELGLLYPPNVVLALLAGERAKEIGLALHFALGAFGALALARRLGAREVGAIAAGVSFMFGGTLVSTLFSPPYVASAAWTTWAGWAALGLRRRERGALAVATASFLAIYLAGDPLGCVFAGLAALALVLASEPRSAPRTLPLLALAAALAALLGAAQLFPSLAIAGEGARTNGIAFEHASEWSFWPPEAAGFLVPFAFGSHAKPPTVWIHAVYPEARRAWAETYYMGPIALALALAGLARLRESALARSGALLVALALPVALGKYTPLYSLLYHLPLVPFFRYPAKLMVFVALGLALLSAAGMDDLARRRTVVLETLGGLLVSALLAFAGARLFRDPLAAAIDARRVTPINGHAALAALEPRLVHAALFSLGALLVLARPRRTSGLALALLLVLDLAIALEPAAYRTPREPFVRAPSVAPLLGELEREDGCPARVVGLASARAIQPEDQRETVSPNNWALAMTEGLEPDCGLGEGVLNQEGFLGNAPYRRELLTFKLEGAPPLERAVRLGARYVLAARREKLADATTVRTLGSRAVLRLDRAPDWASLHGRVAYAKDRAFAVQAVTAPRFDPRTEAVIEAAEEPCDPGARGTVRLASPFGARGFDLDVEASGPSWLVVRETWASGWMAMVDGVPAAVHPADLVFRAVHLPKGAKRVSFHFAAPWATAGAAVSLATALALLLLFAARGRLRELSARLRD
jgi:hypothetical protein